MLAIKYLLMVAGVLLLAAGAAIAIYDAWRVFQHSRWLLRGTGEDVAPELIDTPQPVRWRISLALVVVACLPLLIAMSIVVVPSGMGGVCISDTRGTLPGTLYSGVHFMAPLGEHVQTFDLRDQIFATQMPGEAKITSSSAVDDWAGDCGAVSSRSAAAGLCAVASAAAD
jgi:hypothetical protein